MGLLCLVDGLLAGVILNGYEGGGRTEGKELDLQLPGQLGGIVWQRHFAAW